MIKTIELEKPEIQKPTDWRKFMDRLIGFDVWVEENYKKYHAKKLPTNEE